MNHGFFFVVKISDVFRYRNPNWNNWLENIIRSQLWLFSKVSEIFLLQLIKVERENEEITFFYTDISTSNVVLWYSSLSKKSFEIHNSIFQVKISIYMVTGKEKPEVIPSVKQQLLQATILVLVPSHLFWDFSTTNQVLFRTRSS